MDPIFTSYVGRLNATTRLHMRRLARLTLAFSKKRENVDAAVACTSGSTTSLRSAIRSVAHPHRRRESPTRSGALESCWRRSHEARRTLKQVIQELHGAEATHRESVPVKAPWRGQTVWKADVEVFTLHGHPKTDTAYAWSHDTDDPDIPKQRVPVLHLHRSSAPSRHPGSPGAGVHECQRPSLSRRRWDALRFPKPMRSPTSSLCAWRAMT